eukprot:TRINITY_DN8519_c0_g1_i3.p1 TRINITY_DN8519_c0_g1~~TRINITY_DN8519_c0_g1_i3.p1  ORF type:complete len:167 (-),score=31.50 TRINITY_DN8519_c0_g1_i3:190-690(-)
MCIRDRLEPLGRIRGIQDQLVQKEPGEVTEVRPWVCAKHNEYRTPRKASAALVLELFLGPTGAANFYYGDVLAGVARTMLLLASVMLCCVHSCCKDASEDYAKIPLDHFDSGTPPSTPRPKSLSGGTSFCMSGLWVVMIAWWITAVVRIGTMSTHPSLENSCLVEL